MQLASQLKPDAIGNPHSKEPCSMSKNINVNINLRILWCVFATSPVCYFYSFPSMARVDDFCTLQPIKINLKKSSEQQLENLIMKIKIQNKDQLNPASPFNSYSSLWRERSDSKQYNTKSPIMMSNVTKVQNQ